MKNFIVVILGGFKSGLFVVNVYNYNSHVFIFVLQKVNFKY